MGSDLWVLFWVGVLIALAAVLAASETSIARLTRIRAMALAEEGRRGARFLVRITEDPARFMNPVLVVTLACHILGTTLATSVAVRQLGSAGEWIATAVLTSVIFVFAESAPKTYAILRTDLVALALAPMIFWLGRVLSPLADLLVGVSNVLLPGKGLPKGPFVTEAEIRQIVDVAEEDEVIEKQEREMIHSIFEFGDSVVREVMVPRPDMITVEVSTSIQETMDLAINHGFSRIPVYQREQDNMVGVVYAKDLFEALRADSQNGKTVSDVMREPYFVPETMRLGDLLRDIKRKRVHLGVVVDEYGDVAGLVTLEDILEEIVGEITDEYDVDEPSILRLGPDTWRVQAKLPLSEFNQLIPAAELNEDEEFQTIGGLVASALGKVPDEGDEVAYGGLTFRAERVQRRRIGTVLVRRASADDGAA